MAVSSVAACASSEPPPYLVDLAGEHRFHVGDDPAFAAPDYDDSTWSSARVPGTWRDIGTDAASLMRWYRIHFETPPGTPRAELALDLGVVGWADEVFLNGRLIGATGSLDRFPDIVYVPRLYSLPDGAIRPGANVLAIRTRGWPVGTNGFLSDRIGIGRELPLARLRGAEVTRTVAAEAILFGFVAFAWLLVAFLPMRGRVGRATRYLWLAVTMWATYLWLFSVSAHCAGWTFGANSAVVFAALNFGLCGIYAFVATLTRDRMPRYLIALIAFLGAVGLLGLVLADVPGLLLLACFVGASIGDLLVIAFLVGAVRARRPGAIPILVGTVIAAGSITLSIFMSHPFVLALLLGYYGSAFLAVCGLLALARQVKAMNAQAQRVSEYALAAHTSERTRLARDLHDGLGQMLALLKMQLQRTGGKLGSDEARHCLDDGVAQADATLEELRRIARDLRPIPMQDRKFGEAVREYAASVARRTDLEVEVEGDYAGRVPDRVVDELYRIVQECLTNSLKHSEASRVVVSLKDSDNRYSLAVSDDGRGLPAEPTSLGLGLRTIRERSELLGGSCVLSTPPGGGTRVEVSIPR